MLTSELSDKEISQLLTAIVRNQGAVNVESLLEETHRHKVLLPLCPNELYFDCRLSYSGFKLQILRFVVEDGDVEEADLQFWRPSEFPAPYLNRNRGLVKKLRSILDPLYSDTTVRHCWQRPPVPLPGRDRDDKYIFYKPELVNLTSQSFLEWVGESMLIDRPYSSGATDESETKVRNDFVLFGFRRLPRFWRVSDVG
jgi:hypothetical protein